ncbi:Tex family protein [Halanaerobium salsuginis]|jgi:uncharacterized protein|uniref:S1 motif domain-containing protein n=1 Tax=Halanaerobium salsuginis TaxID=29563 RepID=A0A1I4KSY1_9FIRM|nr:Tex family protein [Halanaerobium salsuginis]SFL81716.1 uncharacterized protein SAMN02983006_02104 [Halanaerobium salsuginis]
MEEYIEVDLVELAAAELDLVRKNVAATIELLDQGNTVPFIARYRKEMTGSLDEEQIRSVAEKMDYLRRLYERKNEVAAAADNKDKLDSDLLAKLTAADTLQEVEDLYRPFKEKKQTKAAKALARGLKPLADKIISQQYKQKIIEKMAQKFIDSEKELSTIDDVISGAEDIIAGDLSDNAALRKKLRDYCFNTAKIVSDQKNEDQSGKYQDYYEFRESINKIPPHRILALNRGESEEILRVKAEVDNEKAINLIYKFCQFKAGASFSYLENAVDYAYKRLIFPALEREIRNNLTEKAESRAVDNFAINLRALLMQPPLPGKKVLAVDPAFRTGCKLAALAANGELLETGTIYPHQPVNKKKAAAETIKLFVEKYKIDLIVIGNGTASRETEFFIAELIKAGLSVEYTIVSEAGASVYSASTLARKEFPELDVSIRGAISIGRRIQDPLAELVKIDPQSLGVGMYQHDVSQSKLEKTLNDVVVDTVNQVGVEVNTASAALLTYVAGISSSNAEKIIEYREKNGDFKKRDELLEVYRFGPKSFEQSAGFIRLDSTADPLAATPIHPESYNAAEKILASIGYQPADLQDDFKLADIKDKLAQLDLFSTAAELELGKPTIKDIIQALQQPGRDPRESMPAPIFRKDILKIDDIEPGMIFRGKVRNIVDFGAFIDIGLKQDGLLHISEMSELYVSDPFTIVEIGQNIEVKVLSVDKKRGRISLTLKF